MRGAILDGRLRRGTRLPTTGDLARQHRIARGTAVAVFEQLQAEGYVQSRVGAGSWVSDQLPEDLIPPRRAQPVTIHKAGPTAFGAPRPARPFRWFEPALDEFPIATWTRIAARRLRRATRSLLGVGDIRGHHPLR